jgi:hypothetical protein
MMSNGKDRSLALDFFLILIKLRVKRAFREE